MLLTSTIELVLTRLVKVGIMSDAFCDIRVVTPVGLRIVVVSVIVMYITGRDAILKFMKPIDVRSYFGCTNSYVYRKFCTMRVCIRYMRSWVGRRRCACRMLVLVGTCVNNVG
jgi:hypothetical protein